MNRRTLGTPFGQLLGVWDTLRFITHHPLNKNRKLAAIRRFVWWQVSSRLAPGPIAINFVNDSTLLVSAGMTGATGNIYTGLHEFEDMSFVIHLLRQGDLFVDIGANIGSYTILAGAVAGARCLAFEPIPQTYEHLVRNINLNGIGDVVVARNIGIGKEDGELKFTSGLDTVNHVVGEHETSVASIAVPVKTLDEAMGDARPSVVKIDVEGFETNVIEGASATLRRDSMLAVVMELNGSGTRYGFDENVLHQKMLSYGFQPVAYSPFHRKLTRLDRKNTQSGNTIYIKDFDSVQARLEAATPFSVNGQSL